jgi:predicted dehydrogenase
MISIGLVGCGAVVHNMYSAVLLGRSEYSVTHVADLNVDRANSAASIFGAIVTSPDELVAACDAVVVSVPPSAHASVLRRALAPEKIVLVEKPFVATRADAVELVGAARAAGARLFVGNFRRLYPQLELARAVVESGLIGTVVRITASEGGRFTWASASGYVTRDPLGGVLWDTGSHTLDMALFAAGLDSDESLGIDVMDVRRDRSEPSHEFSGAFVLKSTHQVAMNLRLSRRAVLPNVVGLQGTEGVVHFQTGLDDRVRVSSANGSFVASAGRAYGDLLECLDLEFQHVLTDRAAGVFEAHRFIGQVAVMEALSSA